MIIWFVAIILIGGKEWIISRFINRIECQSCKLQGRKNETNRKWENDGWDFRLMVDYDGSGFGQSKSANWPTDWPVICYWSISTFLIESKLDSFIEKLTTGDGHYLLLFYRLDTSEVIPKCLIIRMFVDDGLDLDSTWNNSPEIGYNSIIIGMPLSMRWESCYWIRWQGSQRACVKFTLTGQISVEFAGWWVDSWPDPWN